MAGAQYSFSLKHRARERPLVSHDSETLLVNVNPNSHQEAFVTGTFILSVHRWEDAYAKFHTSPRNSGPTTDLGKTTGLSLLCIDLKLRDIQDF